MEKKQDDQMGIMVAELEGRVAGVLARFFRDKKPLMAELGKETSNDPEVMELTLATNALLFQLANLIVMVQRKTGGDLESIVRIESEFLRLLVPACKDVRDETDRPKDTGLH